MLVACDVECESTYNQSLHKAFIPSNSLAHLTNDSNELLTNESSKTFTSTVSTQIYFTGESIFQDVTSASFFSRNSDCSAMTKTMGQPIIFLKYMICNI